MKNEKRPPTADEIAKLIKQSWNSAGSQYPIVEKLRDALEAQRDQLKQAREIIEKYVETGCDCGNHENHHVTCEVFDADCWLAANPAPATEDDHG